MTILDKIAERKKERLADAKRIRPLADAKTIARNAAPPRDFHAAIRRKESGLKLIAEIKKASPSKGVIRADFSAAAIGALYEERQVDAISVITEEDFFQGSLDFLPKVRQTVTRPVLRKDFIVDEYQIYEARGAEADAILLIAALLSAAQADEYLHLARELGMAVLFEVHDTTELEMALRADARIVGINNRNLKTMSIDLDTCINLKREIPHDRIVVAESGIRARQDMLRIDEAKIDAVLIGTSFMESKDIGKKIDELRGLPY